MIEMRSCSICYFNLHVLLHWVRVARKGKKGTYDTFHSVEMLQTFDQLRECGSVIEETCTPVTTCFNTVLSVSEQVSARNIDHAVNISSMLPFLVTARRSISSPRGPLILAGWNGSMNALDDSCNRYLSCGPPPRYCSRVSSNAPELRYEIVAVCQIKHSYGTTLYTSHRFLSRYFLHKILIIIFVF